METLGEKITRLFRSRVYALLAAGIGIIVNVLRKDEYQLVDEGKEIQNSHTVKPLIQRFYQHYLRKLRAEGKLTNEWQRFIVRDQNAVRLTGRPHWSFDSSRLLDAGWWLNNSSKVMVHGQLEARSKDTWNEMRNLRVNWEWHDEIDAQSFNENSFESVFGFIEWGVEGLWDIVGDKMLDTNFRVVIKWQDNESKIQGWR